MSNFLYDNARKNFAMGNIQWRPVGGDIIRFFLVDSQYQPDQANHESLLDIPPQLRYGRNNLWTPPGGFELIVNIPAAGICDAQDITVTGINPGLNIGYIVIYREGISEAESYLISAVSLGSGLPFVTDGKDIHIEWSNAPTRLFRL